MGFTIDLIINVLGNPTVMLGIIACIGLMFLGKNISDIVIGIVKTIMEYLILNVGTTIIDTSITLLTAPMQRGLGVDGVLPLYWVIYAESIAKSGTGAVLIFIIGSVINILPAKFTPWKSLAMIVHLQLFWTSPMASIMAGFGFSGITLIAIGSFISGVHYWIATTVSAHYLKPVTTEYANFTPSAIALAIAGEVGRLFKKGGKSVKEIEFPSSFNWFKDGIIATCMAVLTMGFIFTFIAGLAIVRELAERAPWILYVLIQPLAFGGGIAIIPYSIRIVLAELIPIFSGAAEKPLPNAALGLDYPTVFPYAGTAVILGLVFSLLGFILATLVMAFTGFLPIVVSRAQISFFEGALVGMYANAEGGLKNCILSTFITGFIFRFTVILTFPMTGHLMATGGVYEAMGSDTIGYLITKFMSLFH